MDTVRGTFPQRFIVIDGDEPGYFEVHDPVSDRRWALRANHLRLARSFSGVVTYQEVAASVRQPEERLRAMESRLLSLGLLEPQVPVRRPLWMRVLRALDRFDFLEFDPSRVLDAVHRRAPWLHRMPGVLAALGFSVAILAMVAVRFGEFAAAVPQALRGWGMPLVFLICALSATFHEGGHALACRAYGVPVRRIGLGLRSLMIFAWTEPDQRQWVRLRRARRLVTIAAGPLGSLHYAALGGLLWLGTGSWLGVLIVLAGTVCIIPTLLPIYDGDVYLLLTDLSGRPNLRSQSMAQLAGRGRQVTRLQALGYRAFALLTIAGRVAVAACVIWLFAVFTWPG